MSILVSTWALAACLSFAAPPTLDEALDEALTPSEDILDEALTPHEEAEPADTSEGGEVTYVIVDAGRLAPAIEPSPPALELRAGAMLMARSEFIRTRHVDGDSELRTLVPVRLRARFEARARRLRLLAEVQDARNLGDPVGSARAGVHQLLGEYETTLARASLRLRFGRQEFGLGTRHLYWTAPWGARMRSWDAVRLTTTFTRGGVELFAGSLARPLLSSSLRLADHVADDVAITWLASGHVRVRDALTLELSVAGAHQRTPEAARNIVTNGLRAHGELLPGLRYDLEGHLQIGAIERGRATQKHLAGSAFANLEYLTPEGIGPDNAIELGGVALFDFASGSRCSSTEVSGFTSCTEGTNTDYYSPWMARHAWFGRGDRFLANNVIDGALGLRVKTEPAEGVDLDFELINHVFAFPEPGGRWQSTGTALIGVDPTNRDPWAADELDAEATLRYRWFRLDLGWHYVHSLSGGRAISGVAAWQRIYIELSTEF